MNTIFSQIISGNIFVNADFSNLVTCELVGYVVEQLVGIIRGQASLVIVVVGTRKTVRKNLSGQSGTYIGTCIITIVTKLIQIRLSRNLD